MTREPMLRLHAPAKLNLFLHVTAQRPDGYHELETFFELIDLTDQMDFFPAAQNTIEIECTTLNLPQQDNLIYRAAKCLHRFTKRPLAGCHIRLTKHIPTGAGMGGGSSNAATTLIGLNALWQLGLDKQALSELGQELGADVPVFIHAQSAWAKGTGNTLFPSRPPELWFVLLKPNLSCNTGQIFQSPDLQRDTAPFIEQYLRHEQTTHGFSAQGPLWSSTRNDCQPVASKKHPEIEQLIRALVKHSPAARMTGTGSVCFAPFDSPKKAQQALEALQADSKLPLAWAKVVKGLTHWQHQALDNLSQT